MVVEKAAAAAAVTAMDETKTHRTVSQIIWISWDFLLVAEGHFDTVLKKIPN